MRKKKLSKLEKSKRSPNSKYWKTKADKLWSKTVRSGGHCEYCGAKENLNAHHLITRGFKAARWNLKNAVCLCAKHHEFCPIFSAHKNPIRFAHWLRVVHPDRCRFVLDFNYEDTEAETPKDAFERLSK